MKDLSGPFLDKDIMLLANTSDFWTIPVLKSENSRYGLELNLIPRYLKQLTCSTVNGLSVKSPMNEIVSSLGQLVINLVLVLDNFNLWSSKYVMVMLSRICMSSLFFASRTKSSAKQMMQMIKDLKSCKPAPLKGIRTTKFF